jgi:hypothetical protein
LVAMVMSSELFIADAHRETKETVQNFRPLTLPEKKRSLFIMTPLLFVWCFLCSASIIVQSESAEEFVYSVAALFLFARFHVYDLHLYRYDCQILSVYTFLNAALLGNVFDNTYALLRNPLIVGQLFAYLTFFLYPQLVAMYSAAPKDVDLPGCPALHLQDNLSEGSDSDCSESSFNNSACSDSSCNSQCSCNSPAPSPLAHRRYREVMNLDRDNHEDSPEVVMLPLQPSLTAVRYDATVPIPPPPKLIHCVRRCLSSLSGNDDSEGRT